MVAIALLLTGWSQPTEVESLEGYATYMNPGMMNTVIDNRGLSWADGVALNRAGDLGRTVWIVWDDGSVTGPLPVVDCAQENHYLERERQGRVVEVSARLAKEKNFYRVGPVPVTVLFEAPETRWN